MGTDREDLPELLEFKGICDASAAVALDDEHIVVGDDEQSFLSVYHLGGGAPREVIHLPAIGNEADIEGATILGDWVVWITSHGRSKSGKVDPGRFRLFASHRRGDDGGWSEALLDPYSRLPEALLATTDAAYGPLREAVGDLGRKVEDLAPKKRGFNIEGLTVTRDGASLLVGVRNPQPNGMAALFRLDDPAPLLTGAAADPSFGPVTLLDLGGRGVRDLAWSPAHDAYLVLAGQADDKVPGPSFALYTWAGGDAAPQDRSASMRAAIGSHPEFQPEVVTPLLTRSRDRLEPSARFLLISDDGGRPIGEDKTLKDADRSLWAFRAVVGTLD